MLKNDNGIKIDGIGAWITLFSASMFFFFVYGQMNVLNTLQSVMIRDLGLRESAISKLYAAFFYGNLIWVLPAGLILDRVSLKRAIMLLFSIALVATLLFAVTDNFNLMLLARFLLGSVGAFGFISLVKISSICFSSSRLGLATAAFSAWCTIGGMVVQTPVAHYLALIGWRNTLMVMVLIGAFFLLLQSFAIRLPKAASNAKTANTTAPRSIFTSLRQVLFNCQNWLCGIFSSCANLAVFLLGGVFGVPFLIRTHHYSFIIASSIISLLFAGLIVGNLIFGKLPDWFHKRKPPMYIGSIMNLAIIGLILIAKNAPIGYMATLFALYGISAGCQVLSYPVITESNELANTAAASSLVSMILVAGGTLSQLYSTLLYLKGEQADFTMANGLLALAAVVALLCALGVKETNCQPLAGTR